MKVSVLLENTALSGEFESAHGLSLYIETENHKLLSDTGPDGKFLLNAERMGIDLSLVDAVFLSHGHYDHSGGIIPFVNINSRAPIYMRSNAADDYYHDEVYIGIDKRIKELPQTVLVEENTVIDSELSLFTGITGRRFWPQSNTVLSRKTGNILSADDFSHEQCLVINSDKKVLVSGCAHNGILNILDKYKEIYGGLPDAVISGFHMMKKTDYTGEEINTIRKTAEELASLPVKFYTGHCTGEAALDILESIMKKNLFRISSGTEIFM